MATSPDDPGPGPGWVTRTAWAAPARLHQREGETRAVTVRRRWVFPSRTPQPVGGASRGHVMMRATDLPDSWPGFREPVHSGSSAQVARLAPVSELRVRRALRGARRLGGRGGHTGWSPERTHFTDHAKHFQQ